MRGEVTAQTLRRSSNGARQSGNNQPPATKTKMAKAATFKKSTGCDKKAATINFRRFLKSNRNSGKSGNNQPAVTKKSNSDKKEEVATINRRRKK